MPFSKLRMGKEELFEIRVFDMHGMKIEDWRVMKVDFAKVISILNNKYNFGLQIKPIKQDSDLDWVK